MIGLAGRERALGFVGSVSLLEWREEGRAVRERRCDRECLITHTKDGAKQNELAQPSIGRQPRQVRTERR